MKIRILTPIRKVKLFNNKILFIFIWVLVVKPRPIFIQLSNMKRTSIQSPYFAAYYHRLMKRKNGFKKGMIRDRGEVLRLLSIIWKTVSEHYVEADAGVYVDNVGYLCHVLIPGQRFTVRRDLDIVSRLGTNGYLYNHLAMDFADSKRYYHFVIQDSLKKKLRVKMNKGRRYRFMYNEILAKRRVFKDFQIKRVFEDKELGHRKS